MNWKKVVSVLLIGTMAFSMMACGGKDNSSSNDAKLLSRLITQQRFRQHYLLASQSLT